MNELDSFFYYATAFFAAFIAALWLSLVFWTYRDIRGRSQDRFVQILAALVTAVLGPPGLVVYLILRPPSTLDDAYQRTLEEEALLAQIEGRPVCPGCGNRAHPDWQVCPTCLTRLRKPCARCGRLMELPWQVCPHCTTPAPGVRAEAQPEETRGGMG